MQFDLLQNMSMEKYRDRYERCVQQFDICGFALLFEEMKADLTTQVLQNLSTFMEREEERRQLDKRRRALMHSLAGESSTARPPSASTSGSSQRLSNAHSGDPQQQMRGEHIVDPNFRKTPFTAEQVWTNWCKEMNRQMVESPGRHGRGSSNEDSWSKCPVYLDTVNDRLCLVRRGVVHYPTCVSEVTRTGPETASSQAPQPLPLVVSTQPRLSTIFETMDPQSQQFVVQGAAPMPLQQHFYGHNPVGAAPEGVVLNRWVSMPSVPYMLMSGR